MNKRLFQLTHIRQLLSLCLFSSLTAPLYCLASPGKNTYKITAANTTIDVLVLKKGVLSILGHNHVISTSKISGRLAINKSKPLQSKFNITIPVVALIVDDINRRKHYKNYFSKLISNQARQSTRSNMLKKIFDPDNYPKITIQSSQIIDDGLNYKVNMWVSINGVKRLIESKVQLKRTPATISIIGKTVLDLKQFNIKPVSAALATIKIKNTLPVFFNFSYNRDKSNLKFSPN